jgi:hypothetical protein
VLLLDAAVRLRFLIGACWFNGALYNLPGKTCGKQFTAAPQTAVFINVAPQLVSSFTHDTVLPTTKLFAQLSRKAGLALGVALLFETLTNLVALVNMLYSLLILFTRAR